MSTRCASCHATIIWATSEHGARMPVDAERRPDGNIVLSHRHAGEPPIAVVQSAAELERLRAQAAARGERLTLFVAHHATCPSASRHRVPRAQLALDTAAAEEP